MLDPVIDARNNYRKHQLERDVNYPRPAHQCHGSMELPGNSRCCDLLDMPRKRVDIPRPEMNTFDGKEHWVNF